MPKKRLMTPGPTQIPQRALLKMAEQTTHHRTPDFRALFERTTESLRYVFETKGDVLLFASSGTGVMEAAVSSVVVPGEKILVLESGKFSERWRHLGERFGAEVVAYVEPWGVPFSPDRVAELLRENPDVVAVYCTLLETSTGVLHDVEGISLAVRENSDALVVVDGISGVGADRCPMDAWGIDILCVGGQKALMGLPGIAMLGVSERAWEKIESTPPLGFYFDLSAYRRTASTSDTPFTPPKSLMAALAESLELFREAGLENVLDRMALLAEATRAGVAAMGLELAAERPANGMTTVKVPESIDGKILLSRLEERFGLKFAGGQGDWKGRIFRIAHMGIIDELDVISALAGVEMVLAELGYDVQWGSAVATAERVFHRRRDA